MKSKILKIIKEMKKDSKHWINFYIGMIEQEMKKKKNVDLYIISELNGTMSYYAGYLDALQDLEFKIKNIEEEK